MINLKNQFLYFFLFLTGILFLISCKKERVENNNKIVVTLYSCSEKAIEPYICFDSLIIDSRCPKGVECVWAGTALVKISFGENGNIHPFKMYLGHDTTINSYKIAFTDLIPYPDDNTPIPEWEKTIATFTISQ